MLARHKASIINTLDRKGQTVGANIATIDEERLMLTSRLGNLLRPDIAGKCEITVIELQFVQVR